MRELKEGDLALLKEDLVRNTLGKIKSKTGDRDE